MPTRYVYDIKREARGCVAPQGQALYIVYMYYIRHDLCNLCHRGMSSEVFHLLLHEVRKLIFLVVICGLYILFC